MIIIYVIFTFQLFAERLERQGIFGHRKITGIGMVKKFEIDTFGITSFYSV